MSDNESLKIVKRQTELENEIEKALLKSCGSKEEVEVEDEFDGTSMILNFEYALSIWEGKPPNLKGNPLNPEEAKVLWSWINRALEKDDAREAALGYAADCARPWEVDMVPVIFEKWLGIVRHAAENGNWYYHHIAFG